MSLKERFVARPTKCKFGIFYVFRTIVIRINLYHLIKLKYSSLLLMFRYWALGYTRKIHLWASWIPWGSRSWSYLDQRSTCSKPSRSDNKEGSWGMLIKTSYFSSFFKTAIAIIAYNYMKVNVAISIFRWLQVSKMTTKLVLKRWKIPWRWQRICKMWP